MARMLVKITSIDAEGRHGLILDLPTDTRELDELHEMARTLAETAGLLDGHTMAVTVTVRRTGLSDAVRRGRGLRGLRRLRVQATAMVSGQCRDRGVRGRVV